MDGADPTGLLLLETQTQPNLSASAVAAEPPEDPIINPQYIAFDAVISSGTFKLSQE